MSWSRRGALKKLRSSVIRVWNETENNTELQSKKRNIVNKKRERKEQHQSRICDEKKLNKQHKKRNLVNKKKKTKEAKRNNYKSKKENRINEKNRMRKNKMDNYM